MVAAIKYDSKVWTAGVTASWARELDVRGSADERERGAEPWRDLDRQLRSVAARRAALDAEELALIRRAIAVQIWRPLGMMSMREYLEVRMGYGPQVAAERLRVADALEGLPAMEAALASNELTYSAVRELTRIATHKTEEGWLAACRGKVLRQIEEMVAEREPGDGPDARPKPHLRPKRVSMALLPAVVALMRQAHATLDALRGERNDCNDLLGEAFRCLLAMHGAGNAAEHVDGDAAEYVDGDAAEYADGDAADGDRERADGGASAGDAERADGDAAAGDAAAGDAAANKAAPARSRANARRTRRAMRAQIATITKCESCGQGWQLAAGRKIALTPAELETAECDAVHIGSLDGPPGRATSTIPPATRRQVEQRDNYKCTVPWCRSGVNIDVHHIVHREHGGGHEPWNLTSMCSGHHDAHHRGELLIEGRAPALTFVRRNEVPHVGDQRSIGHEPVRRVCGARRGDDPLVPHVGDSQNPHRADALLALTTLGFTKHEAKTALAAALALVPPDAGLDPLLRAALRELR